MVMFLWGGGELFARPVYQLNYQLNVAGVMPEHILKIWRKYVQVQSWVS